MNRYFLTLLVAACVAALLAGYGARRLSVVQPVSQSADHAADSPVLATVAAEESAFPPPHSADTLDALTPLEDAQLYARLALWLVEASEPDIAAFWSSYLKREDLAEEITDLIFFHWVRLNPQRTIAVAAESGYGYTAWKAWACYDPQASLAAASTAPDPDWVDFVVEGIGKFHPDWLLKHLEEIPEASRDAAISVMSENGGKNPFEILPLLKEHHAQVGPGILKALAREDPWAAVEWARQNSGDRNDPFSEYSDALTIVLQTLAEESPDELARIAGQTPSGKDKLVMEATLFANLLKTDPAAALEQAKSTTVPRIAAERYAAIGLGMVRTDPAQALQLAKDLLAACPGALDLTARIQYPDGETTTTLDYPGTLEFMSSLMSRQPQQVMGMIASLPLESENSQFNNFSEQWISQDLVSYTNWVNQQADPIIRRKGAFMIVDDLEKSSHYQEAAEWASSMDIGDTAQLDRVLTKWQEQDPEAPARWLEDAKLPPARRAVIQTLLDHPR